MPVRATAGRSDLSPSPNCGPGEPGRVTCTRQEGSSKDTQCSRYVGSLYIRAVNRVPQHPEPHLLCEAWKAWLGFLGLTRRTKVSASHYRGFPSSPIPRTMMRASERTSPRETDIGNPRRLWEPLLSQMGRKCPYVIDVRLQQHSSQWRCHNQASRPSDTNETALLKPPARKPRKTLPEDCRSQHPCVARLTHFTTTGGLSPSVDRCSCVVISEFSS